MTRQLLKYSLDLDRELFDEAEAVVLATLRVRNQPSVLPSLYLATSDKNNLPGGDRKYVESHLATKDGLDGACCTRDDSGYAFNIWLNPNLDPFTDYYRFVLLHELTHGYLREVKHNLRFRDFYSRVLYHYSDLAQPAANVEAFVKFTEYRYSRQKSDETDKDFLSRINRRTEIARQRAEEEQDDVRYFYERFL